MERKTKIILHYKQFSKCCKEGYTKESVFVSFKDDPNLIPTFPTKDMVDDIKSGEWNGLSRIKCGRFNNGFCSSENEECRKMRGLSTTPTLKG